MTPDSELEALKEEFASLSFETRLQLNMARDEIAELRLALQEAMELLREARETPSYSSGRLRFAGLHSVKTAGR
jgi:hypothetical protein